MKRSLVSSARVHRPPGSLALTATLALATFLLPGRVIGQISGGGEAYGLTAIIDAAGILDVNVPPTPEVVQGATTSAFDLSDSIIDINAGDGLVITGVFQVATQYPGGGSTMVDSDATVNGLALGDPI